MQILAFPSPRKVPDVTHNSPEDMIDNIHLSIISPPQPIVVLPHPGALLASLGATAEQARTLLDEATPENTRRAYRLDWQDFTSWCEPRRFQPLPASPETLLYYLTELAVRYKVATIERRLAAISQVHQAARLDTPTRDLLVRKLMEAIRRKHGVASEQKAPAVADEVKAMVAGLGQTRHALQERALLLVGFAGAFRRSELVALDVGDLKFSRQGLAITIRRSKTDQEGQGRTIGIPFGSEVGTCPVRSLRAWLKAGGIESGPVFRPVNRADVVQPARLAPFAVARAVKRGARRAGLDPDLYAGHSLRAGLATSAAAAGVEERVIAKQTGHRSMAVLRRYIREGELFRDNAAGQVGL